MGAGRLSDIVTGWADPREHEEIAVSRLLRRPRAWLFAEPELPRVSPRHDDSPYGEREASGNGRDTNVPSGVHPPGSVRCPRPDSSVKVNVSFGMPETNGLMKALSKNGIPRLSETNSHCM